VKYVVKRSDFDYYSGMTEGVPTWRKTRTFFEKDEAMKIAGQLRALGFKNVEALEFHESPMKARK